jgi:hypothetical protein
MVPVGLGDSMGKDARKLVRRSLLQRLDAQLEQSHKVMEVELLADLDPLAARRRRQLLARKRNPLIGVISQLVSACDATGVAMIRQQTLAERVGCSPRTVRRQLKVLQDLGIVEVSPVCWTADGAVTGLIGGRQGANRYQLVDVWNVSPTRTVAEVGDDSEATISSPTAPDMTLKTRELPGNESGHDVRGGAVTMTTLYSQQINSKAVVPVDGSGGFAPLVDVDRVDTRGGHFLTPLDHWRDKKVSRRDAPDASLLEVASRQARDATHPAAAHRPPDESTATDGGDQVRNGSAPTGLATATDGGDQLRDDLHSPLANAMRDAMVEAFPEMIDRVATELALMMLPHPNALEKCLEILERSEEVRRINGHVSAGYVVAAMRAEIRQPSRLVNRAAERSGLEAEPSGLARYGSGASGADLDERMESERERSERRFAELTGLVAA